MDGVPVADAIRAAVRTIIDAARNPEFTARLERLMRDEAPVLARLAEFDDCDHSYPEPNGAGFPVDQCLKCGLFRTAEALVEEGRRRAAERAQRVQDMREPN